MYFGKMHDKIINERISCYFREIFLWDSSFLCYVDEENACIYAVHLTIFEIYRQNKSAMAK